MQTVITQLNRLVPKKHIMNILTHIAIKNGVVVGGNGRVQMTFFTDHFQNMSIVVNGAKLLAALTCGEEPPKIVVDGNQVKIISGKFKATLLSLPLNNYPVMENMDNEIKVPDDFLMTIRSLMPFIGDDASRPWACGINFTGKDAVVTNNQVLARMPCDTYYPFNLSLFGVRALAAQPKAPVGLGCNENIVSFHYDDGAIMTAKLSAERWPDVSGRFHQVYAPVPLGLEGALKNILPFCPDMEQPLVRLSTKGVSTTGGEPFSFAEVEMDTLKEGVFNARVLLSLLPKVTDIDFSEWPNPCPFSNEKTGLQGVVVRVRY